MAGFMQGFVLLDQQAITLAGATTNDLAISSSRVEITPQATGDIITGFDKQFDLGTDITGPLVLIINVHASFNLVLKNNDSGSIAANRIFTPTAADLTIPPFNTAILGYAGGWRVIEVPRLTAQSAQTRTINGTGFQVSTIRNAQVAYCVQIAASITLGGSQTGTVFLEISPDNSAWTEVTRFVNGNSGTVIIGVGITQTISGQLNAYVPRGYFVRLRQTSSGSPTITYIAGQEVLL